MQLEHVQIKKAEQQGPLCAHSLTNTARHSTLYAKHGIHISRILEARLKSRELESSLAPALSPIA